MSPSCFYVPHLYLLKTVSAPSVSILWRRSVSCSSHLHERKDNSKSIHAQETSFWRGWRTWSQDTYLAVLTGTHRRAEILGFPPLGRTASIVTIKYVCTEGEVGQDSPRDTSQSQNSSHLWRIRCLSWVDAEDGGSALPLSLAREAGVLPFH